LIATYVTSNKKQGSRSLMKDKKTRNVWIDLRECFMLIWEIGYLETDENGILY
jgi:hypothetical protein